MRRFIKGADRAQASLLPASLEDYVDANNPVRVIKAFVDALDLDALGFAVIPAATGRPGYHPAMLLKLYVYGYLNCIQSSRRLERECQRNIELMWLTGRLAPDFKTIADFRRNNGLAICAACAQFIVICRDLDLFTRPLAAIDGSKFKGVNARDKNFTRSGQLPHMAAKAKEVLGFAKIDVLADSGYFNGPDLLACHEMGVHALVPRPNTSNAKAAGRFSKAEFVYLADRDAYRCPAGEILTRRCAAKDRDLTVFVYWATTCTTCPLKERCTTGQERRVRR